MNALLKAVFCIAWWVGTMTAPQPSPWLIAAKWEPVVLMSYSHAEKRWTFSEQFMADLASATAKRNREQAQWGVSLGRVDLGFSPDGTVVWRPR